MRRVRITAVLLCVGAAMLVGASAASAAGPRQILNDYMAHGHFTHHYSQADINRACHSTLIQGYSHGHHDMCVPPPPPPPSCSNGAKMGYSHGQPTCPPVTPPPPGLPFTGMDLGLITFGAVILLAFGAALRRFARSKA